MRRHPYFMLCLAFVLVGAVYAGLVLGVEWVWRTWENLETPAHIALAVSLWLFLVATVAVGMAALWRTLRDMFSPRVATWVAGLASLAFAAVFVHGLASGDAHGFGRTFGPLAGTCLPIWLVCTALCGGGAFLRKRHRRVLPILLCAVGLFVAFGVVCVLGIGWFAKAPFRSGFRTERVDGPSREVVLSRAWCGWWKGFDLCLYVRRNMDGRWEAWSFGYWPYPLGECVVSLLDHGVPGAKPKAGWGFSFLGQRPRDGEPGSLGGEPDYSGNLSPAELHAIHRKLCKPSAMERHDPHDDHGREMRGDEGWTILGLSDALAGEGGWE